MKLSVSAAVVGAIVGGAVLSLGCAKSDLGPQSFNIHTTGDSVPLAAGRVTIVVPAGAISENGTVTATPLSAGSFPANPLLVTGSAFGVSVAPSTLQILTPIRVRLNYAGLQLPSGVLGSGLQLNAVVSGNWQPVPGGTNDTANSTLAAPISAFGVFGVVGVPSVSLSKSTISVSSSTVESGKVVTLTLQAKDANDSNLTGGGLIVVFTSSGGTSTGAIGATTDHGNGVYTASFTGQTVGTATTIGATINGSPVTSTLPMVTVKPTSGANPNEPSGMTIYSDRDFNDTAADANGRVDASQVHNGAVGWFGGTYSFSNGYYTVVSDTSARMSPPHVGQITYHVGLLSGFNPLGSNAIQQLTVPANAVRTIYTHQFIKLSSTWLPPTNSGVAKLGFIKRQDDQPIVYIVLQGSSSPFTLSIRAQDFAYTNAPPSGWSRNLGSVGDDHFAVGMWNDLEVVLVMNSAPGVYDGSVDVWLNGKHIISTSAAPYDGSTYARPDFWDTSSNPGYWEGPSLEPTWGGADGFPNPTLSYAWWDRFYVSGKP